MVVGLNHADTQRWVFPYMELYTEQFQLNKQILAESSYLGKMKVTCINKTNKYSEFQCILPTKDPVARVLIYTTV